MTLSADEKLMKINGKKRQIKTGKRPSAPSMARMTQFDTKTPEKPAHNSRYGAPLLAEAAPVLGFRAILGT
jgi:hypothetical protein